MKSAIVSVVALLGILASCAGLGARGDAMGTIVATYRNVIEPVLIVGIGAEQDAGNLSAAEADQFRGYVGELGRMLEGGNVAEAGAARAAWELLLPFAEQGIDARVARGEIGPGVGASLKEVLRLFGERLVQIASEPVSAAAVGSVRMNAVLTTQQWAAVQAGTVQ